MKVLVSTYKTASDRIALASARSVATAGHEVWVATDDPSTATCHSRSVKGVLPVRNPISDLDGHAADLVEHVLTKGFDTILPTDDYSVHALSKRIEAGDMIVPLPVPALAAQVQAMDKNAMTARAAELGLATPKSRALSSAEDVEEALATLQPPWVVKLARGGGSVGMLQTADADAVRRHFADRPDHSDPIYDFRTMIIQEHVAGKTHDAWVLMNRGKAVFGLAGQRRITYPLSGGAGVLIETIERPAFFDQAVRLLESLGWHGPADVEFLVDPADGTAYFIEINGRLWGGTGLALHSGVNFAAAACEMAVEGYIEPDFRFPAGKVMRWQFPNGPLCVAQSENKLAMAWELFRPSRSIGNDVQLSDPAAARRQLTDAWRKFRGSDGAASLDPTSLC